MAREIELKLSLREGDIERLRGLPLLTASAEFRGTSRLHNQYFDTPEQALAAHRVALRIREDGGHYIQTLKTRGASQGGLHQRNEWEWDLPQPLLDYALLAEASWPAALNDAAVQRRIQPAFRTDFERSTWLLRRPGAAGGEALVELVLDLGEVTTQSGGRDRLCEIELELKAGRPEDLYGVALEMASQVSLLVSDISKAERGYRLLGSLRPEKPSSPLTGEIPVGEAFRSAHEAALNLVARGLEQWRQTRDWQGIGKAADGLALLQATLACFSSLLPETAAGELLPRLATVTQALYPVQYWQKLLPLMDAAQAARWQAIQSVTAEAELEQWLGNPEVGCLLLECGRLLMIEDWPPVASQSLAAFRIMNR